MTIALPNTPKIISTKKTGSLAGHLLIATQVVEESCFARSVIYMCAHNADGAMGVIVNYPVENIGLEEIFDQLKIFSEAIGRDFPVHFGGPVEAGRGFVIHSTDYASKEPLIQQEGIAVTASAAILHDIAAGKGPQKGILALGYAGWSSSQLESEIEGGSWLVASASPELIFADDNDSKWSTAIASLGFDMGHFSTVVGHA